MLAGAALAYSFLVTFVLTCLGRNRRSNRRGVPALQVVGWTLMSGSLAMSGFLLSVVAMQVTLG